MLKKSALVLSVLAAGSTVKAFDYQSAAFSAGAGAALEAFSSTIANVAFTKKDKDGNPVKPSGLQDKSTEWLLASVAKGYVLPQLGSNYNGTFGDLGGALLKHREALSSVNAEALMPCVWGILAGAGANAATAALLKALNKLDGKDAGLFLGLLARHWVKGLLEIKDDCAYDLGDIAGAWVGEAYVTPRVLDMIG